MCLFCSNDILLKVFNIECFNNLRYFCLRQRGELVRILDPLFDVFFVTLGACGAIGLSWNNYNAGKMFDGPGCLGDKAFPSVPKRLLQDNVAIRGWNTCHFCCRDFRFFIAFRMEKQLNVECSKQALLMRRKTMFCVKKECLTHG